MSPDTVRNLQIIITSDSAQASADMKKLASDSVATSTSLKTIGSDLTGVGKSLTTGVTLPIVGAAAASVDLATKFQQNMTLVRTQANDTTDNINTLSNEVLQLSKNSKFSPDELATGLYHITSVGLTGANAINALNAAQKLAAVGNSQLEDTTQAVTVAWKSGISGAEDFGQAAASLNAIVGAGDMHMQDLVQAMGPTGLLSTAKSAGIALNDVGAAEALMADMTGNAQQSATHLRTSIQLMVAPSQKAQGALSSIGIGSKQLAVDMQEGGLPKALQTIHDQLNKTFGPTATTSLNTFTDILNTKGTTAADNFASSSASAAQVLNNAFGGAKSSATIIGLVSNLDQLGQKETAVANGASRFSQDYADTQQTMAYKAHAAWATIQADAIVLGQQLLPVVATGFNDVATDVTKVIDKYESLSPTTKKVVDVTLGLSAALGPTLFLLGSTASKVDALIRLYKDFAGINIGSKIANVASAAPAVGGVASTAVAGGEEAAIGGAAAAATPEIATFGAALAGLAGPLAILAAGAVGTALVVHTLDTNSQNAAKAADQHATALSNEGKQALTTGGAHKEAANLVQTHTQAVAANKSAEQILTETQKDAKSKTEDLGKAHDAVTTALQKYGQNSPQYQKALMNEADAVIQNQQAQQALTKAQDDVKNSNTKLTNATQDLNAEHIVLQQNLPKSAELNKKLSDAQAEAKSKQADLNTATGQFNTALTIFGANSPATIDAAKKVTTAHNDLAKAQNDVKQAQNDINNQMAAAKQEYKNLGGDLDTLAGKYNNTAGSAANLAKQLGSAQPKQSTLSKIGNLLGFAGGTDYAPGGVALVGEEGPELINLPRGSAVTPATQTSGILNNGSGGNVHITIQGGTFLGVGGIEEVSTLIYQTLQRQARANGYNGALPQIGIMPTG